MTGSDPRLAAPRNTQIETYLRPRELKDHEKRQLELIEERRPEFRGRCLDIGCATGYFLRAMAERRPDAEYVGIDISPELLAAARDAVPAATFLEADAVDFEPDAPFDVIVAAGVLSIFDDFAPVLDRWLSWLAPGGLLLVFGRFNSRPVDTIIRFRNHHTGGDWQSGLTAYSVATVSDHLRRRGVEPTFERFVPGFTLSEHEDPIRNYTVDCDDGRRLLINGANVVAEYHFLVAEARR
jgi:SAM-dependent methyltransferase